MEFLYREYRHDAQGASLWMGSNMNCTPKNANLNVSTVKKQKQTIMGDSRGKYYDKTSSKYRGLFIRRAARSVCSLRSQRAANYYCTTVMVLHIRPIEGAPHHSDHSSVLKNANCLAFCKISLVNIPIQLWILRTVLVIGVSMGMFTAYRSIPAAEDDSKKLDRNGSVRSDRGWESSEALFVCLFC